MSKGVKKELFCSITNFRATDLKILITAYNIGTSLHALCQSYVDELLEITKATTTNYMKNWLN